MKCLPAVVLTAIFLLGPPAYAEGPHISGFSPQGTVKKVRQVRAAFSEPMVPFGDPRGAGDPFAVECAEAGRGRWLDPRTWVYDFERDGAGRHGLRLSAEARGAGPLRPGRRGQPRLPLLDRRPRRRDLAPVRGAPRDQRGPGVHPDPRRRAGRGLGRGPRRGRGARPPGPHRGAHSPGRGTRADPRRPAVAAGARARPRAARARPGGPAAAGEGPGEPGVGQGHPVAVGRRHRARPGAGLRDPGRVPGRVQLRTREPPRRLHPRAADDPAVQRPADGAGRGRGRAERAGRTDVARSR